MKQAVRWATVPLALVVVSVVVGFTRSTLADRPAPVALLNESYSLIGRIDDSRQAYYLLELTRVGAKIGAAHEKEWATQMFHQSFSVQDPWDRVALEKNALVALSTVDARAAMDLLLRAEAPVADANGKYPEDVWADGASQMFPNRWDQEMKLAEGRGDAESRLRTALADIREAAAHIGNQGEYPYRATANVIKKLAVSKTYEPEINEMFGEAVAAYSAGKPKFRNRNSEFLFLLQNTKSYVTDAALYRKAVTAFVNAVKAFQDDVNYEAEYRTQQGTVVKFTDRRRALLFRAFPIIREVDPQLAKSLAQEYGELDKATEIMTYIPAGVIERKVTPEQATAMHSRMQQISLLAAIESQQETDALEAKRLAESLPDSQIRFLALSSTLPGLMRVDPASAKAVYDDQRTQLQELNDEGQKSQALVALAKSAAYVKDQDEFSATSNMAFNLSVELYNQDSRERPELRPDLHKGYSDLHELVQFTVSHSLSGMPNRIQQLQDDELKAHLLVFAAEGLSESK